MDRDDCLQSLANIQATLELVSQTAAECWKPDRRRWVSPEGEIYDLAGTLDGCYEQNGLRHALRWIEFNTSDGPGRRKRLAGVLVAVRNEVDQIEDGHQRSDPFRWTRESIHEAAATAASELQQVADYIGKLIDLISPHLTPIEARNKFCFEQWQDGEAYKQINAALRRHAEWEAFEDDKAVRSAINSWAKRIGATPRKGQPGRRAKA